MTDFLIDPNTNDWVISDDRLKVVEESDVLTTQRLYQRLKTFRDTLFTNLDYGVSFELMGSADSKQEIDQHYKKLILSITGITTIQSFTSEVGEDGLYSCTFEVFTAEGETVFIENLG